MFKLDNDPRITPVGGSLLQVGGRSNLKWVEDLRLDLYVNNWSLIADLSIMARTGCAVAAKDGAV